MPKNILITLFIASSLFLINGCSSTSQFMSQLTAPRTDAMTPSSVTRASISDDAFWQGNAVTLWDRLQHLSSQQLTAATTTDPMRAAWIKLVLISKRYNGDTKELVRQLAVWRSENPKHPGNELFPSDSTLNSLINQATPTHIALLLPLQGPMRANGQAVRDGFLNAYYQALAKTHIQQTISFYDTNANPNISALYQQALSQGADLVVGPLIKEDVQALLSGGSFHVPTLALNYTDISFGSLPTNFYEFGLSAVDEVQQVADKAWQSGRSRAIIIAPQNAWGQRVTNNLTSRWNSLGGKVTDTFYYSANTDFIQSIAKLLHVSPAGNRKTVTNSKTTAEQQRRQDFDVIFLLAEPQAARQIVPLLRYNYAQNVPIYATSVIYSGSPNPQKDNDLNGIIFTDIPWVIRGAHNSNRLYAVGHDAYQVSNELSRLTLLPNFPIYGGTGALTLTSTHQIYRRLPWAQIHNGQP